MTIRIFALLVAALILTACGKSESPPAVSALPVDYVVVDLAEVATAEAFTARCAEEDGNLRARFAEIEAFSGIPTLDGYYRSLDSLFTSVSTIAYTSSLVGNVHPDEALRAAAEACEQLMAKVDTDMGLSRPLYDALSRIDLGDADDSTRFSAQKLLLAFRLAGVDRSEEARERIRSLNDEILAIGLEFDRNIREDVRYLEIDSVEGLAGLPDDFIEAHQPNEEGKILISTQYPDVFPFFEYADSDELRKALSLHYNQRGYPQNESVLKKLIEKRYELAQLIGFNNYAELVTADKMSGSPERVTEFLEELNGYTRDVQDREYEVLLARLREDQPEAEKLESWQRSYIQSKVKREQYDVDSKVTREYFGYNDAQDGIFTLIQEMFGVRIVPWDTGTWHEDVEAFQLFEGDQLLGSFYLDMHPRDGKYQHAAHFGFVKGIEGQQLPVSALICNFPRGDERMQFSQVVTFLHEFGHLIHSLFAGHQAWSNVSGISTERDFVEAPSQMLQEWVWDYETVARFARNTEGETLPKYLHARMVAARDFGIGMSTRGQLAYASFSMSIYDRDPAEVDFDTLAGDITRAFTPFEPLEGGHYWAAFGHLNGYSAIYYTYQWSKAIATDMFTEFKKNGLNNTEIAGAYRDKVLAKGGTAPANELVTDFLGREISFEPYAERLRGTSQ